MDDPNRYIDSVIFVSFDKIDLWSGNMSSPVRSVKLSEVKRFLALKEANNLFATSSVASFHAAKMPLPLGTSTLVVAEKPRRYPKRVRKEVQDATKQAVVVSFILYFLSPSISLLFLFALTST